MLHYLQFEGEDQELEEYESVDGSPLSSSPPVISNLTPAAVGANLADSAALAAADTNKSNLMDTHFVDRQELCFIL